MAGTEERGVRVAEHLRREDGIELDRVADLGEIRILRPEQSSRVQGRLGHRRDLEDAALGFLRDLLEQLLRRGVKAALAR
jgi:hypothetical protein